MKKLFVTILALSMMLSTAAFAAGESPEELEARKQVPATAVLTSTVSDGNTTDYYYEDKVSKTNYKVSVSKEPLQVISTASRVAGNKGGRAVVLSQQQAEDMAKEYYAGANVLGSFIRKNNDRFEYLVLFDIGDGRLYRSSLNAENGKLIGTGVKFSSATEGEIALFEAAENTKALRPDSHIMDIELENENGKRVYEVKLWENNKEVEIKLDAATGQLVEQDDTKEAKAVPASNYKEGVELSNIDDDDDDLYDFDDDDYDEDDNDDDYDDDEDYDDDYDDDEDDEDDNDDDYDDDDDHDDYNDDDSDDDDDDGDDD
ncbi:MAG: PepSY domain-containing protein [Christensenellales bacterium]|jgi:uncharacterized membrane protein YkoI